jgi:hypothetical protein
MITADPPASSPSTDVPGQKAGHRRRAAAVTRPGVTAAVALVGLLSIAVVPSLLLSAYHTVRSSTGGKASNVNVKGSPIISLAPSAAGLLVVTGADAKPVGLTVLGVNSSGTGGAAIVVPVATALERTPPASVGSIYASGGLEGEVAAVEELLGIRISSSLSVDQKGLAELLAPYAPVAVTFTEPVTTGDAGGAERRLFPAGAAQLSAADAAAVLVAKTASQSEIVRLPRIEAFWRALTERSSAAGAGSATAATGTSVGAATTIPTSTTTASKGTAGITTIPHALAALVAGPATARLLVTQPELDPAVNPSGGDLFTPDAAAMRLIVAQVMPGAVSPVKTAPRLRIINSTGDPQVMYRAVARLIYIGANIVFASDDPGTAPKTTRLEYQDAAKADELGGYRPAFGSLDLVQTQQRIDGIDATIIIGQDFVSFSAQPTATTVPTVSVTTAPATTTTAKA